MKISTPPSNDHAATLRALSDSLIKELDTRVARVTEIELGQLKDVKAATLLQFLIAIFLLVIGGIAGGMYFFPHPTSVLKLWTEEHTSDIRWVSTCMSTALIFCSLICPVVLTLINRHMIVHEPLFLSVSKQVIIYASLCCLLWIWLSPEVGGVILTIGVGLIGKQILHHPSKRLPLPLPQDDVPTRSEIAALVKRIKKLAKKNSPSRLTCLVKWIKKRLLVI